jgi:hypothetical protein
MRAVITVCLALSLAACQSLPPRSEMLESACAEQPCRAESRITLHDASGRAHEFLLPAGPVFAGGVLSIAQGETQHLSVRIDDQGEAMIHWLSAEEHEAPYIRFHLDQVETDTGHASRLRISNRTNHNLWLEAEQFPVNQDRFYPLALSPIAAGRQVSQTWPHTILEVQITGLRVVQNQGTSD